MILLEAKALLPQLGSISPVIKKISLFELVQGFLSNGRNGTKISINILPEERLDKTI